VSLSLSFFRFLSIGLGKTIQVISFLAHLSEKGVNGPHLIIVPFVPSSLSSPLLSSSKTRKLTFSIHISSSTLENWAREFQRFCPDIEVQTYYGTQADRAELGYQLVRDENVEVVLTTYTIASGTNKDDKKFFRKMGFQVSRPSLSLSLSLHFTSSERIETRR